MLHPLDDADNADWRALWRIYGIVDGAFCAVRGVGELLLRLPFDVGGRLF